MKNGVILVLLMALVVVIAGCKAGDSGGVSSSSTPFIGGTEGLRVSFVENSPPAEVLDNPTPADISKIMNFDVTLNLENMGEQDIAASNLKTTVGGIFPADFNKQTSELQNVMLSSKPGKANAVITGIKKDPEGGKISGGIEEITFDKLGYVKMLEGNNEFPVQADFCYRYTTKAVGNFCMRQDITKAISGVCTIKGSKPVFSSGAPIQVVSLGESVGGAGKVLLKFNIKAVGQGSFFKPEAIGNTNALGCPSGDFSKENFVKMTVKTGLAGLSCSGFNNPPNAVEVTKDDVRLSNGEASITCIQDNVNVDAVKPVNLVLEYNHLISTSTKILVKHLPFSSQGISPAGPAAASQPSGSESCTTGAIDNTCRTSSGAVGIRMCRAGIWSDCIAPGGPPT